MYSGVSHHDWLAGHDQADKYPVIYGLVQLACVFHVDLLRQMLGCMNVLQARMNVIFAWLASTQ